MTKRKNGEDDICYSPREILASLNNATIAAHRIPDCKLRRDFEKVINKCGKIILEDLWPVVEEKLLSPQELVLVLISMATYIQYHAVMGLKEMPFGPLSFAEYKTQ